VITGKLGATMRASYLRGGKLEFAGRTGGFRSYVDYDSTTGLEVIFVGNAITGASEVLRDAVSKLAAGGSVAVPALPALSDAAPDPKLVAAAVGDFRLENGTPLAVRAKNGALWANEWLLVPTTDGAFFSRRDYGLVRFVAGKDGAIERLDWTQNGVVYPAPRVKPNP
jgi:hypothetical protein